MFWFSRAYKSYLYTIAQLIKYTIASYQKTVYRPEFKNIANKKKKLTTSEPPAARNPFTGGGVCLDIDGC